VRYEAPAPQKIIPDFGALLVRREENERALLIRWCGNDNAPPIILETRRLFNATIVGIESADEKLHVGTDWVQMSLLEELQDGFRQSR